MFLFLNSPFRGGRDRPRSPLKGLEEKEKGDEASLNHRRKRLG
jgi:hypothetical protein